MQFKKLKLCIASCMVCIGLFVGNANAQNEEGTSVASLNAGYSLVIDFVQSSLDIYEDVSAKSIPVIGVTYDYSITDLFSMGLAFGYQSLTADFSNSYLDDNLNTVNETATTKITRMNVAVRPLLHYGGSDELDLYSGFRVGITSLNASYETNDPDFSEVDDLGGTRFSLGIVAFGMRYFFTDNFGANFDVQIGSPYIASGGVSLRF